MNILRSVHVEGFWGTKNFAVDFHPDVNFLIGVNGSGKTTLINMIAAALNADLQTLDRLPFDKITIHLEDVDSRRKPVIEIEKQSSKDLAYPRVSYRIHERAHGPVAEYNLDEMQQRISREHLVYRERIRRVGSAIVQHLRTLVNLSWLTIHRAQTPDTREDRGFESTVDRKLVQMATDLIKYFSLLNRQGEAEQVKFQEAVFLSLVARQTPVNLFAAIAKLNLQEEKNALIQIFEQFHLSEQDFATHVAQHFDMVQAATAAMESSKGFTTDQFSAALAMARIHALVQEWHGFGERRRIIYKPQEDFLAILNRMMVRKTCRISEKNELITELSGSNAKLELTDLSSGEKQLLIILGEALLQQKAAWVYIADEPELSLHMEWQVQLITNLRSLNPQAQILFATHSPDIVSSYGDRVFSMEKILA
jgi:predicted ATPase